MNIEKYNEKIFEEIKHIDENVNEHWEARELKDILEYAQWRRFNEVINRAMISCDKSGMFDIGSGAKRNQIDYKLSRYACYLIV